MPRGRPPKEETAIEEKPKAEEKKEPPKKIQQEKILRTDYEIRLSGDRYKVIKVIKKTRVTQKILIKSLLRKNKAHMAELKKLQEKGVKIKGW